MSVILTAVFCIGMVGNVQVIERNGKKEFLTKDYVKCDRMGARENTEETTVISIPVEKKEETVVEESEEKKLAQKSVAAEEDPNWVKAKGEMAKEKDLSEYSFVKKEDAPWEMGYVVHNNQTEEEFGIIIGTEIYQKFLNDKQECVAPFSETEESCRERVSPSH